MAGRARLRHPEIETHQEAGLVAPDDRLPDAKADQLRPLGLVRGADRAGNDFKTGKGPQSVPVSPA